MNTKRLIRISILASILSILSLISIPAGPVPITLQTLGVLLCGYILGPFDGMISVIVYILLGSFGIPVFSGGKSGFQVLLGPTGGYLLSFIPAAVVSGYASMRFRKIFPLMLSGIISIIIIYMIGVPFLSISAGIPLPKAAAIGMYPFIVPDIVKMIVSVLLGIKVKNRLSRESIL